MMKKHCFKITFLIIGMLCFVYSHGFADQLLRNPSFSQNKGDRYRILAFMKLILDGKVVVKRNNVAGKEIGQVNMKVKSIKDISGDKTLSKEVSNSFASWDDGLLNWYGAYYDIDVICNKFYLTRKGLEILADTVHKTTISELKSGQISISYIDNAYLVLSDGDVNGNKRIDVEGVATVQYSPSEKLCTLNLLEVKPNNRDFIYTDLMIGFNERRNLPISRFIGVGEALFWHAALKETQSENARIYFDIDDWILAKMGLESKTYTREELLKHFEKYALKILGYLNEYANSGDEGARTILEEIEDIQFRMVTTNI